MGTTNFTSIPDPGNSTSSQQATLLALTAAMRSMQATVGQLTGDGLGAGENSVLKNLSSALGNASASIKVEQIARTDALSALAEQITTLKANFDENYAIVVETLKAYADANSAIAQDIIELTAVVNTNYSHGQAQLTEEQTARVDGDVALASDITDLSATISEGDTNTAALVHEEAVARADGDSALAQDITDLSATVTANHNTVTASITDEQTARADADTAMASDVEVVQAQVTTNTTAIDGHTTILSNHNVRITTNQTAIATVNGTLSASYGVTLDIDGYMTGFNLLSTGVGTGSFNIRADLLTMVIPGYAPQPIMTIQTINGVPTLTFDGNIVSDNSLNNNAIADGAVGSSGTISSDNSLGLTQTSGVLTLKMIGRKQAIFFISVDVQITSPDTYTLSVKVDGTVIASRPFVWTDFSTGIVYKTGMFQVGYLLSAGSHDFEATLNRTTNTCNITLTVIELGA